MSRRGRTRIKGLFQRFVFRVRDGRVADVNVSGF